MNNNILHYLKSKILAILAITILFAVVSYALSFTFQKQYKTDVYCYSNVFDNVHNKSVFQSFNIQVNSGNTEAIQALTNMKPEVIEQISQVDFFSIISSEDNYFKLSMISKTNNYTPEYLAGIEYYFENAGINKQIIKSELDKINSKIKNKQAAITKIDSIYAMMNKSTHVIFESNLEESRNIILNELEDEKIKLGTFKGLTIINEPFAPKSSYFPNKVMFGAFGLVLGFILSLLFFVVKFEFKEQ